MSTLPNYTASSELPIITFDYDTSPYGQKVRTVLAAAGIPHKACIQPRVLPRPDLEALGVTYRRIPVLSIGCDMFCDSSLICEVIQERYAKLPTTPADKAYEAFGTMVFASCLPVMPARNLTPEFVKDRETIFPVLKSPNFGSLRPSALAELKSHMLVIENDFLSQGTFIGGDQMSLADVHVIWSVRWFLTTLGVGKEPGFSEEAFPKIYKWIACMPPIQPEKLDAESSLRVIKGAGHTDPAMHVDDKDPLGIASGTDVVVESRDTKPGAHPQHGRLVGLYPHQFVLQLESGVRLHFPRAGYIVRPRADSKI